MASFGAAGFSAHMSSPVAVRAEGPAGAGSWSLVPGAAPGERWLREETAMRRWSAVTSTRAVRAVRELWPDRNPLRRSLDRVEAAIVTGLAVAFLAAAPVAAVTAGHLAHGIASRNASAQRSWRQVPAVLLASATVPGQFWTTVPARWAGPGGARHTGWVPVLASATAGRTVMVWTDASGQLTDRPLRPSQVWGQAVMAAVLAPVVLGLLLGSGGLLAHGALGRRRIIAWDADWQATEPLWTRRR